MPTKAVADRKLLLGILKLQNVTIDYGALSKYMSSDGTTCTVSAIQNRINRLKAQANKEGGAGAPGGADTPMSKGKGGGRKKRTAIAATLSDDDEESPSKRTKGKKEKTAASAGDNEGDKEGGVESVVKAEEDSDDDA